MDNRDCGKLRDRVEGWGGTMVYQREGYQYGAWVISLNGKQTVIKSTGNRSHPQLDQLYVPKVVNPETWDDYRDELLDDAHLHLRALLT